MKTFVIKETDFIIPIWSVTKARKLLDRWSGFTDVYLKEIRYEEKNLMIFSIFTVFICGDAAKVNTMTRLISDELNKI